MKATLRALAKKVTLVSTAFVLAVSTLTAAMPFISSQEASAASSDYKLTVQPADVTIGSDGEEASFYVFAEYYSCVWIFCGWNDLPAWEAANVTASVAGGPQVSANGTTWDTSATAHNNKFDAKVDGTFHVKSSVDGTFTVAVATTVKTLLGGTQTLANAVTLNVLDKTAPVVTSTQQAYEVHNGVEGRYVVTLTFNEAIDTTALEQGWYEVAGSNKTQLKKVYYSTKQYTAHFQDLAGNAVTHTFTITPVVNSAPVVTFVSPTPADDAHVRGTITPRVVANDDYGTGSYYIRLWKNAFESGADDLVYNDCYSAPGAFLLGKDQDVTCSAIDTTTLTEGKYVLSAQFLDGNGAWGTALRTITVDNTDPTLKVNLNRQSYVTSGATVGPNQIPEIEAADTNFDRVDVIKDGTVVNSWARNGTYTERRAKIGFLAQGTYTIRAYDVAGNTSDDFVITIDKTGPTTNITNAAVSGDTLNFEGTVSDSNLSYYYCYLTTNQTVTIDGHTFTPGQEVRLNNDADSSRNAACATTWAQGQTDFTGTLGGFNIAGVPDGDYTINLVAYDLVRNNNAANPATFTFTLDRTAPAVTITTVTTTTITGTADLDATIVLTIDGVDTAPFTPNADGTWTYTLTTPLAVGSHTVVATAYDSVGNARMATASLDVLPATDDDGQPEVIINSNGLQSPTLPPAVGPVAIADVQGDSTSDPAVEGTSTEKTPAQAVDIATNDGTVFGIAWYWWLLILAAIAAAAWWVLAAIRRRQAE